MAEPDRKAAELLAAHPFVEGMDEAQLRSMAECVTGVARFATDQMIFHSGGIAKSLYLIRGGDVALEVSAPGGRTTPPGRLLSGPHEWSERPARW